MFECVFCDSGDLFADDGTHGSAHEGEVHKCEAESFAFDTAGADDDGIFEAGFFLGLDEPVCVGFTVGEVERISGGEVFEKRLEGVGVKEAFEPLVAREVEVVIALGSEFVGLFFVLFIDHFLTSLACQKEAIGYFFFCSE